MAGGGLIGALRVTLSADTAQFQRGMAAAEARATRSSAIISRALGGIKTGIAGLAAGISIGTVAALASEALDYASSLGEVAQQLGVTTKDLQEYRYAASQAGVDQETMDKSLAKLTQTMGKAAAGAEAPKKAFAAIGISLDDLRGKTAGDVLPMIADALAKIESPAERAAIELALLGKTGQQLDTLLAGGSAALNELRNAAQSLGVVLSDEQIQSADATADKLSELKTVLMARIAGAVADNAASIYDLADAFVTLTSKIVESIGAAERMRKLSLVDSGSSLVSRLNADIPGMIGGFARGLNRDQISEEAAFSLTRGSKADRQALLTKTADEYNSTTDPDRRRYLRSRQQSILKAQRASEKAATTRPPSTGGGDVSQFLAGGGGKKKTGKSAEQIAAEAARKAEAFARDRQRAQDDIFRSEQDLSRINEDLTVNAADRLQFERNRIARERDHDVGAINRDKDMTDAERARLVQLRTQVAAGETELTYIKEREMNAAKEIDAARARTDNENELLSAHAGLARTATERKRIEMLILKASFEQLRLVQQAVLASETADDDAKQAARDKLKQLDQLEPMARAGVEKQNMLPLQQYLDSIPRTAEEMNEALNAVAADGVSNLVDGLAEVATGARSLVDVVKSMANSIIADLIRIQLRKAIAGGIGKVLGGLLGGSSSVAGPAAIDWGTSTGISAAGSIALPKLAGGGAIRVGGTAGVDTNLLSINGMPAAMVSRGETIRINPDNDNGRSAPAVVQLVLGEGQLFEPRVQAISGDVSVETIGANNRSSAMHARQRLDK